MINCVVGKTGRGKTYFLVKLAIEEVTKGIDVYHNIPTMDKKKVWELAKKNRETSFFGMKRKYKKPLGKIVKWTKLSEIYEVKHGTILLDEMHLKLDSRKWYKLDDTFKWKISQSRHHFLDVWGATQNFNRVDVIVRDLTDVLYKVDHLGKIFYARAYDPEDYDKEKSRMKFMKVFFFSKAVSACYDTHEDIPLAF